MHEQDMAILHHALGISDPMRPDRVPYRNHFVVGPGHADMPSLERLEEAGLMVRKRHALLNGGDRVFTVTEAGKALALQTRPRALKAKIRYGRFLRIKEVLPDLTFREFLTTPQFANDR